MKHNTNEKDYIDNNCLEISEKNYSPDNSLQEILVVDDNPTNLKLIHTLLTQNNYKIRIAKSGKMALRSASSNPPSLILMDITMPEMDGFEACQHLKQNSITKDIPVIFLSALKEEFDIVRGFDVGGVDFVTKPFKSEILLSRIRTHLTIYTLRKQLSQMNTNLEQQVKEQTQTLNRVYKISQSLTEEIKLKPLFEKLMPILLDNCNADYTCIIKYQNNNLDIKTSYRKNSHIVHHDEIEQDRNMFFYPTSIAKQVEETHLPYWINNINEEDAFKFRPDPYFDTHKPNAIICFPVLSKNELLGLIYLEIEDKNLEFDDDHMKFIEILMSHVSIAIENAQFYKELEQKVEERTTELKTAQNEILKSERLATLGKLTASVAHELRHPLGTIRSSSYALRHKINTLEAPIEKILDRIERNVHRCDGIISEMLEYTREKSMQLEPVDLEQWLPEVLEELEPPDGINFKLISQPVPTIYIDSDRFRRVIINLFNNACQAMNDPVSEEELNDIPMSLTVDIKSAVDSVMIIFTDTGPGIPDEVKKHIFEPLYSTKSFGIGLGLPIVKQIVEKHQGNLEIESSLGNGTKVICTLAIKPELKQIENSTQNH
jgi:signal transduction histidine kinase/DNA-binding response OmpR family regulator